MPSKITHYQVPGRFGSVDYLRPSALVGVDRNQDGSVASYTFHVGGMRCVHYDAEDVVGVDLSDETVQEEADRLTGCEA